MMTPFERLSRIRDRRPSVAVVGDFLLDGWWSGSIDRIAREAPAPIVDLAERRDEPGGAANTALNLAALGARVRAIGAVGDDEAGARLLRRLAQAGVDTAGIQTVPGAQTTTKVRVSVDDQVLLRIDETQRSDWPTEVGTGIVAEAARAVSEGEALLICDYGSPNSGGGSGPATASVLSDEVVSGLAALPRPELLVIDAHDLRRWRGLRPHVVTPNAAEAEAAAGAELGEGEERVEAAAGIADGLMEATGAAAVVVTLDRSGTVLLRPGRPPHRTRAHPAPERQASGAGDVFVAALTNARASGLGLEEAAEFAQQAADVAVRGTGVGTCACSLEQLQQWLGRPAGLAVPVDRLRSRLEAHRRAGERIVFTNGCFDVLHRGHTSCLRQAERLGDVLVVGINSDDSARRLKGPGRPVNSAQDRADVVAELSCVDYVTVFDADTACDLIRALAPDVYAKGGDYTPEMLAEAEAVREVGGDIVMLDYVPEHSTTELLGRIRAGETEAAPRARAAAR